MNDLQKNKNKHLHTDVACKADVGTSMWFAHHSHDCDLWWRRRIKDLLIFLSDKLVIMVFY